MFQKQNRLPDLLAQTTDRFVGEQRKALDFRQIQYGGGELGEPLGFLDDNVQIFLALRRLQLLIFQKFGHAQDGNDGRFEFVRKIADKIRAQKLRAGQLLGHLVKTLRKLLEFLRMLQMEEKI